MVNPAVALLWFLVLAALGALLFWPREGLVPRLLKLVRMTERVRIEDALKHLYDGEYSGRPGTLGSLAGQLEISKAGAAKLVGRLVTLRLIRSDGVGFPLTDAGREYALRVLRTHRLWERYLADRTNLAPVEWHDEAEREEHRLTAAGTEELAARMGHPLYDPHGDPIPTAAGELPPPSGVALTSLDPGQAGTIVHLEDEPREIYEKLASAGLAPLMRIQLEAASPDAVRFVADGVQHVLEPVVASNVTVLPLPQAELSGGPFDKLSHLEAGESATVVQIAPGCQGPQRRRLLDLGLVPGTVVTAELEGALGDPVAYRIRGALIALRRQQSDWVYVDRARPGSED